MEKHDLEIAIERLHDSPNLNSIEITKAIEELRKKYESELSN
jgi:hypothetical protein